MTVASALVLVITAASIAITFAIFDWRLCRRCATARRCGWAALGLGPGDGVTSNGIRLLVCGGRDYADREVIFRELDETNRKRGPVAVLINGGARGVDSIAAEWALTRGIAAEAFHAEWAKYGRGAGPIRNQRMIDEGKPDVVVAFRGGRGTADMIARAEIAELPVLFR